MTRWVSTLAALVLLLSACSFDQSGIDFDAASNLPDARESSDASDFDGSQLPDGMQTPDGQPDALPTPDAAIPDATPPDAGCEWTYDPRYLDPCSGSNPAPDAALVLDDAGTYHYDTDTGTLTTPGMAVSTPQSTIIGNARAIWVAGFAIDAPSTLRVEGSRPLIIISTTNLAILGTLDASSHWDTDAYSVGAGSEPTACPASPPDPGQTCAQHGGSGGGGGAFGGDGGNGGEGGDARDCGGGFPDGIPGGDGGDALVSAPAVLRGGCNGRDGAPNDGNPGDEGVGGPGGGAVHLTAQGQLVIGGLLHAGGAGGRFGQAHRAGGGAGGSGGFIGLEAAQIDVQSTAVLACNGGGGGGGCDNSAANQGEDAKPSSAVANGGPGQGNGAAGGFGGYIVSPGGQNGLPAERGGGGGGGGVGFIALYSPGAPDVHGSAIVSPSYVTP